MPALGSVDVLEVAIMVVLSAALITSLIRLVSVGRRRRSLDRLILEDADLRERVERLVTLLKEGATAEDESLTLEMRALEDRLRTLSRSSDRARHLLLDLEERRWSHKLRLLGRFAEVLAVSRSQAA